MDRLELSRALDKIQVEAYLDREGVSYSPSYGTNGLQLNLHECPACGEGGRKTYVNAETGLGKCFHGSCNFGFNKFKLIQKVSGLAGRQLDEHISAIARDQGWMPKPARVELVRGALKLPSKLHRLPVNGQNLQYLQDRGVTVESCEHFELSYCHKGWWTYTLADGQERFVSYDERVIIPIADLTGTLVSFQGRDVSGKRDPKYLFPVGFAVAGSHLYNGQNWRDGEHTHAVVGEGAFDAIAVHQALLGHASCNAMLPVATFGMHLSGGDAGQLAKFARLRERGLRHVTMMWDAEGRAMSMAVTAGLQLLGLGLTVSIAQLPRGFDPAQGPDGKPTPPDMVRQAIFQATKLDNRSAIRLAMQAKALG